MVEVLNTLKEFRSINASFPYTYPIQQLKKQGKKVIGWACNYAPEEIPYAAGMIPLRLTADSKELSLEYSNAYMTIHCCSFTRSCLEMILKNQYDFLDGFVTCTTCDPMRYLFEHYRRYHPIPFIHLIDVPGKFTPRTLGFYQRELTNFKERLEEHFNVKITEQDLRNAIDVYNKTRILIKRLYELKKSDTPPISGAETLEVMNAAVRMPKADFNRSMESLLEEISAKKRALQGKTRIMLIGSILQNHEFIKGIEALGGLVVTDALCNGARYMWDTIDSNDSNSLQAISKRYLNHFPCPRMSPWEDRIERIINMAKEYRVDGVIAETIRYCVPHDYNLPLVRGRLEEQGIPMLSLDVEYGMTATGQVRTRVQAFIEMLTHR